MGASGDNKEEGVMPANAGIPGAGAVAEIIQGTPVFAGVTEEDP